MSEQKLRKLVEKRIPGLVYIITVFAMIEFGILVACMVTAANQTRVTVYDASQTLVYEDIYNADALAEFRRVSGIENFKDEGFTVARTLVEKPFPTRTWIALSICVPLLLILFVAFVVRVFEDVFLFRKKAPDKSSSDDRKFDFEETRFEKLFSTLGRLNIYSLGATVIIAAFLFWMVPDLLITIGKISYQTISQLKWVLLSLILVGGIYVIVQAILSHKTKITIIEQQSEIQKNRDRLTIEARLETRLLKDKGGDH
ncbi:MAG: hypothetical protein H0S81_05030 [Desulfotignum balticum]|jgi:hypothetical protein|uniref:Uncharacterized protein n=1 Tax=Desulfotignum balticum TaxID=115781 RepID=A0A931CXL5_9BACT|nr:hypothetical protein [Desulfotignum balticum]